MPKICIQAGHSGRTSGATGAPGEQSFNIDVASKVSSKLTAAGIEVHQVNADPYPSQIAGDWDLFLAIHYDADVYNDDGGFVDFPYPESDGATERSQYIAKILSQTYFPMTGIKNMPQRSNKNTRGYYMWSRLSAKTPCVIIECGVGNRRPKDFEILSNRELIATAIANGVLKALNVEGAPMANMYGSPNQYDLSNPDSMKVAVNHLNDILTGKYIKTDEHDRLMAEQKEASDKQLQAEQEFSKTVVTDMAGIATLLGLPMGADVDAILAAVKSLKDQPIPTPELPSSPCECLPVVEGYVIDSLTFKKL